MMRHHDSQSANVKGNTRGPNIHQQYHTSTSPNSGMHHQMSHVMGQSEHHQQGMEANMLSRPDDNLRHSGKSQMNPFLMQPESAHNGTQQMPSQKQRFLDAMMLSSVSGDPNRPGPPGNHPELDSDARNHRGGFDPSFPHGSNAVHQDGGGDLSYRNALRAIQLRGSHSEVHGQNPSSLVATDKDNFKSSPYYQGMPPSQDRPHSGNMQQASAHGSQNYDGPMDAVERRVSASNVQAPSMRNVSRDNSTSSASPHPMMAGGPYGSSQHLHDQEAYNYYMVNKPGGPPNFYNQYPTVSPDESQDHLPFANNNGKIPYYPEDQQPHPYSYMLGNARHQDKRARHAYDTMAPDYANFAGHQPMHHPGFGRAEQEMMHHQQGGFMLPSFDPRNHPYSGMMHPHMGMPAPAPAPSKPIKAKKRYSGDMPRRPLTAYNFFFSEEREIILAQLPDEEVTPDEKENIKSEKDGEITEVNPVDKILSNMRKLDDEEMNDLKTKIRTNTERMLKIHKESDRVKKSHKKVHGKIAFQHLAKIVGQRWRNLPADEKKYYEDLASKDSNRYNEQLEAYNKKEQEAANKKDASE